MNLSDSAASKDPKVVSTVAKGLGRVAGEHGVDARAYRCRSAQAEQRAHLAEMIARAERPEQHLTVCGVADDIDVACVDHVDQIARIALTEQSTSRSDRDIGGCRTV